MKWIKASERFPNDPESVIMRKISNRLFIIEEIDQLEDEFLIYKGDPIYYDDIEWLDESIDEAEQLRDDYNIQTYKLSECVKAHIDLHSQVNKYREAIDTIESKLAEKGFAVNPNKAADLYLFVRDFKKSLNQ